MWHSKRGKKALRISLDQSWRFPILYPCDHHNPHIPPQHIMKYNVEQDYIAAPFQCFIEGVSRNKVAIRSWNNVQIKESRVAVYDLQEKSWWEIENVNTSVAITALYNDFRVCITEKILAIRVALRGQPNLHQVRVWSLTSKRLIYEELVENLVYMCVNPFDTPHLLILYSREIGVINFKDEDVIAETHVPINNSFYSFGSFVNPFILQCLYDNETTIRSVNVWKYDEEIPAITLNAHIPNLDTFVNFNEDEGFINSIEDIAFYEDLFFMTSKLSLREAAEDPDDEDIYFFCLAIQIVDTNGTILKQKLLYDYDMDTYIEYYFFENKFLFEIMHDVFILSQTLRSLVDEAKNGTKNEMKFTNLMHLDGRANLMLSRVAGRNVSLTPAFDGTIINVKTVNFWSKPY